MKWKPCAALLVLVAACELSCTTVNPDFVGFGAGVDGGATDGSPEGHPDLHAGGPDLAPVCTAGQRACLATTGSAACQGGQLKLDRKCPTGSSCTAGYCQAPPMSSTSLTGQSCDVGFGPQENNCFANGGPAADTLSCEPFVTDPAQMGVSWVCAPSVGQGLPGTACTRGDECRSGFCGSNGTCFRACAQDNDCPFQGSTGKRYACNNVDVTVEGVTVSAKSCIP